MKVIDFDTIQQLNISPSECVKWVKYTFEKKYESQLPAKISIKNNGNVFFNTMPAELPYLNKFGVKIVSRFPQRTPALQSDLLLYDSKKGDFLALMDGTWITTMRTGAVSALTINLLQKKNAKIYAFMGLGNTARATLLCLLGIQDNPIVVRLLAYKGQEFTFIDRFKEYSSIRFEICQSSEELITGADVVVSCVTAADDLIASDDCFGEGVLLVPIHTKGFQNCDLFFDKVFADDIEHIRSFKYFDKFKSVDEMSRILLNQVPGRENDTERILAYNIGIAIHDIYFASKIYEKLPVSTEESICLNSPQNKHWI